MSIKSVTDNKVVAALVVAIVMWLAAKVSGVTALPEKVVQHETRITNVETETRTLRESGIKRDEQFNYIKEQLDRLLAREERRR